MESLIKADIFFFITSIAVVLVSVLFSVALFYVIRILRNVDKVAGEVREEAVELVKDVRAVRLGLKEEGLKVKHVFDFMTRFLKKTERKTARGKHKDLKAE